MKVEQSSIPGHAVFTPRIHKDRRGLVYESYKAAVHYAASGDEISVAQSIVSVSHVGVLRGIHLAASKVRRKLYVTCLTGAAYDLSLIHI